MTDIAYTVVVVPDTEDGGYYAFIPDLQGVMGDGETPQEAVSDVISAAQCWETVRAEQGREMPQPGEADRHFDEVMQERDDYIESLESENAELKAKLREATRRDLATSKTGSHRVRGARDFSPSQHGYRVA